VNKLLELSLLKHAGGFSRFMHLAHQISRCISAYASALGLTVLCMITSATAAPDTYSEDAVKAAYLFRIAGYVSWPEQTPSDAPFVIAVLGSAEMARELRQLLPGHLINNRPAQIREIRGAEDLGSPQILYVGTGRAESLQKMIPAAGLPSTLLVTDEEGGLKAGSTLNFLLIDRRVRFEVSLTAADRSGLKISAELLGVAVRVHGGGRQSRNSCAPYSLPGSVEAGCAFRVVQHNGPGLRRLR